VVGLTPPGTTAGTGRREQRKQITRRELLQAGRRLFSERGLYEPRIEDLTESAGIAKGTLYLYFRDKDALIDAVVTEAFAELRSFMSPMLVRRTSASLRVSRLVEGHLEFLIDHPDWLRILHQARGRLLFQDGPRVRWFSSFEAHVDWIADRIAETPEGDRVSPARRRASARVLFGSISGVVSVHAALGVPLRSLWRHPGLTRNLTDLVLRAAWDSEPPRMTPRLSRSLPLRR
jgi:AcrR family transcriptional regulator